MNPGSRGIPEPDQGNPQLAGGLDDIGDFFRVGAAHRARQYRTVLSEDVNRAAVNFARPRDHAVRGQFLVRHPEIGALGFRQHELLDEATGVEKLVDAFPGRQLAVGFQSRRDFGIPLQSGTLQSAQLLLEIFFGFGHLI